MEAFSLLSYWKAAAATSTGPSQHSGVSSTTTLVAAVSDRDSDSGDDDGPFFDLEFAVPADDNDEDVDEEGRGDVRRESEIIDEDVEERELEPNLTFSPSDDLFFKGRILQIDGQEEVINSGNKSGQFPIPISLSKSATKFRVFLLGLKRSKSGSKQCPPHNQPQNQPNNKKFFTVKFKVEEVPIFSLLSRASSHSKVNTTINTAANEEEQNNQSETPVTQSECSGDERRNRKEVVQKYLKMVKIKASKKSEREATVEKTEKIKVSQKRQGMSLKHLGKSKSASVQSTVQSQNLSNTTSSKKRDDSLLQQQDGIQSAILHCKRSFNSSQDFFTAAAEEATAEAGEEEGNSGVGGRG